MSNVRLASLMKRPKLEHMAKILLNMLANNQTLGAFVVTILFDPLSIRLSNIRIYWYKSSAGIVVIKSYTSGRVDTPTDPP